MRWRRRGPSAFFGERGRYRISKNWKCGNPSIPEYALYSLFILARHILMHDHGHIYRMEERWLTRDAYLTKLEG